MSHPVNGPRQNLPWEDWELDQLRERYPLGNLNDLAREFGRSRKAVQFKAERMGLRRNLQETRRLKREAAEMKRQEAIQKGHMLDWERNVRIVPAPLQDPYVRQVVTQLHPLEMAWRL